VALPDQPGAEYFYFEPPKRFQHRYWIHIALFLATLASTTYVGRTSPSWTSGLWYALPILIILTAHEFGHYIACRIHQVDATLPYYIPAPFLQLTGTLGAVIKIREPFPNKRALFDIGVAGPIAGFVMLIPFLWWGIAHSEIVRIDHSGGTLWLGEPLLFKGMSHMIFGTLPSDMDLQIHPTGFAAWFGMLATALNLMPFGQLDGGHIAYAAFGRKARYISIATLATALLLTVWSLSWISMAIMMSAMAYFLGFGHPYVIDAHEPLDRRRTLVALLALIIFVVCFTPVPIDVLFDK
jgi:membrane-associated protease RseP (regulator of RpoE activity)